MIWCDEFVAQQVEHNTFNVGVLGSSPSEFTRRQSSDCRLFLYLCHKYKTANLRAFMGLPILHTYDLCAVSAMTLRDIRAPASSPDDNLRIVVFFLFVAQQVAHHSSLSSDNKNIYFALSVKKVTKSG